MTNMKSVVAGVAIGRNANREWIRIMINSQALEIRKQLDHGSTVTVTVQARTWLKIANAINLGLMSPLFPDEDRYIVGHIQKFAASQMPKSVRELIVSAITPQQQNRSRRSRRHDRPATAE